MTSATRLAERFGDWNIPEEEAQGGVVPGHRAEGAGSQVGSPSSQKEAGLKLQDTVMAGPGVEGALRLFDLDRCGCLGGGCEGVFGKT